MSGTCQVCEVIEPNIVSHRYSLPQYQGLLFIKAYVEMFAGKLKKKKVNYENFPQSTHAAIIFILLSSVAFHAALWPAYGWKTFAIMILVGYGVLLQFCLLVPTYVQNIVGFVAMTFFIQEYV